MSVYFVADQFVDELLRGAELNDAALMELFDFEVIKLKSESLQEIDPNSFYIVANHQALSPTAKTMLMKYKNYLKYEHDFQYCASRDPSVYDNEVPPTNKLTNIDFFKNAQCVVCLTDMHQKYINDIVNCNFENIHGSVFSEEDLLFMDELRDSVEKRHENVIIGTDDLTKGTPAAIRYCEDNNISYEILKVSNNRRRFLSELASYKKLIYLPMRPEPCSRMCIEAKALGLDVISHKRVGIITEDWISSKGKDITNHIRNVVNPLAASIFKSYIEKNIEKNIEVNDANSSEIDLNGASFGDSYIDRDLYDFVTSIVDVGGTILEFGSGQGSTRLFSKRYTLYSVEDNIRYVNNILASHYIHAPIVNNWYDLDVLRAEMPKDYDFILVDGPLNANMPVNRRWGFVENLDMFRKDVPVAIDDIDRENEKRIVSSLVEDHGYSVIWKSDKSCVLQRKS